MKGKSHKAFPWIWYLLALCIIVAFAFAPIGVSDVMRHNCERVWVQGG
jgi:uncharacterized membrane protein